MPPDLGTPANGGIRDGVLMVAGVAAAAVCCLAGTLLLAVGGGVVAHGVVRVLIDGAFTSGFD